ncbi:MAG: helix-turn-helix domain-containing protein [Stellaceae bacterium]
MPSSAVRTFSDPDDYAASIRQGTVELTVTGRGQFTAKLARIDFHRLWMQRFSENLPRVCHVAGWGGRAIIAFRTQPGPSLLRSGFEVQPTNIVRHSEGQSYFQHSSGLARHGTMSLPVEDMVSVAAMAGIDLTPPKDALAHTPEPSAMAKLQRLHAAAGRLAEEAPEILANPDAARGLEQALIGAMVDCLGPRQEHESSLAQGQHAIVMRRFRRVLEENSEQPLFIPEICKAIGVSERTLRVCCQEHLGMSPKRYLLLRRMHMARQALRAASADAGTVTDLATRYGFWQLGRFAVEYRWLFGEMPSATLHRQAD